MKNKKQRVVVGLSGGVDSSVSVAVLQQEGYDVAGAFIKTWTVPWLPCTWREERRDAMRVAAQLRIPFHTVDLSKEYERDVVEYMISEYKKGQTPNPDVMCNKQIKFGAFYDWAMKNGFDYIATGHYARNDSHKGSRHLRTGVDKNKDQTYFLWTLTQEHLCKTLFPVGKYQKKEVRNLAQTHGLVTAQKKDSQGICFLGKVDMKTFLQKYIPLTEGNVLDTEGGEIGKHEGAIFYTMGQRHGFTIEKKTPHTPALYVVDKDVTRNTITVAAKNAGEEYKRESCTLEAVHFIQTNFDFKEFTCQARIRYRQTLFPVTVQKNEDGKYRALFDAPQPYVANGQSIVFYTGEECLGGAIIG